MASVTVTSIYLISQTNKDEPSKPLMTYFSEALAISHANSLRATYPDSAFVIEPIDLVGN